MKPYKGENSEPKDNKSKPSGLWRKKFPCRRNKGEHTFKLVKPRFLSWIKDYKEMSVEEYYRRQAEQVEKDLKEYKKKVAGGGRFFMTPSNHYAYECTACGKEEMKSDRYENKKIKVIVD